MMSESLCYQELRQLKEQYGAFAFNTALKKLNRERGIDPDRPKRKPLSPSKRNQLYVKQGGKCARCNEHFSLNEMSDDHLNAHAGADFNDFRNRRLVCRSCNSSKNANTLIEEAKRLGTTVVRLYEEQNELHEETEI